MLETSDPAADRRLNLLLAASVLTALVLVTFAVVAIPKILSSASTTAAIRRGDELAACRAGFRTDVDDAAARLQTARARLDSLTNEGLEASVRDDDAALIRLVVALPAARDEVEHEARRLEQATNRYRELVGLSRTDEAAFLSVCREESS